MSMKVFNTTANCVPEENYMVDIGERLSRIKKTVDEKQYFTINRPRQYGKTTTLKALEEYLRNDYLVVSLDFQNIGHEGFQNENEFSQSFAALFTDAWVEQTENESSIRGL